MSVGEEEWSLFLSRSVEDDLAQKGVQRGWSGFDGKTSGARSTIRETKGGGNKFCHLNKEKEKMQT